MALDLSRILGVGAHEPLVDLEDDIGAAARAPGPISTAPPAFGAQTPSPSFADTILGIAPDETRSLRRSLTGGLSAAAANDDQPAMTAAMAEFGGAPGAGKGEETGVQRKIDMLDRAIRAHRIGDMDEVQRALAELLEAQRASQAAQYGMPNAGAMAPAPTWSSTFYDNILGIPLIGTGDTQPVSNDRAPGRPQASGFAAAAAPTAGAEEDHDAILDQALRAAYVPPEHLEPHHLVGAATLMAKQGLTPADAYERFVMQSMRDIGLIDSAGWQDLYGFGVGGDVQPASAQQNETPEQRDLKDWPPRQAPTNQGRETGPSDPWAALAQSEDMPLVSEAADSRREYNPIGESGNLVADAAKDPRQRFPFGLDNAPAQGGTGDPPSTMANQTGGTAFPPLIASPRSPVERGQPVHLAAMDKSMRPGRTPDIIGGGGGGGYSGGRFVRPIQPGYQSPAEILAPGGKVIGRPGRNSGVRELDGGSAAAQELFEKITQGGVEATPRAYNGVMFQLPGRGGFIGLRHSSTSGPPTIDVKIPGLRLKLKFP